MDVDRYFVSLSDELVALKDRVRQLIHDAHWPTDGQWKESVLRSVLRRHAPANVGVGSGFVVTPEGSTGQIDVLLYDTGKPVLFRDSDLVIITRDAYLGMIEVKTRVDRTSLRDGLEQLATKARFLRDRVGEEPRQRAPFIGFFAYESRVGDVQDVLDLLDNIGQEEEPTAVINHVALGPSHFIRFWQLSPTRQQRGNAYNQWHAYEMDNQAFGYFITNAVEAVSPQLTFDLSVWFPRDGKERHLVARRRHRG